VRYQPDADVVALERGDVLRPDDVTLRWCRSPDDRDR
jgi:hypothetical protein